MGGLLLQAENRGALVPTRTLYAHQLPRATSSNSGSQNLCEGQDCNVDPTENRQHHSSGLHKQSRRDSLQGISDPHKRSMDVVPEKNIHIAAVHLNTVANTESRQMLDRTDWKLNPVILQKINNFLGPWTRTCLHPDCPPSAHITSAGGQIPMHWQPMQP